MITVDAECPKKKYCIYPGESDNPLHTSIVFSDLSTKCPLKDPDGKDLMESYRIKYIIFIIALVFNCDSAERDINSAWCSSVGGIDQFRTKDGTYVDCLTDEYAIEAEYDNKWKEGIGQALHYAESTNRKAAILFIKRAKRKITVNEMMRVINRYELPLHLCN